MAEKGKHGLHKRWVERKLEIEVGKVQAKLLSKGMSVPEPDSASLEANARQTQSHLPKLFVDLYGRNPNGTHKLSPERLHRGSAAKAPTLVQKLERMLNPGIMTALPDELAAAHGLPLSPPAEYGEPSSSGRGAYGHGHGYGQGHGGGSPGQGHRGLHHSLGSPRLGSPRAGSPRAQLPAFHSHPLLGGGGGGGGGAADGCGGGGGVGQSLASPSLHSPGYGVAGGAGGGDPNGGRGSPSPPPFTNWRSDLEGADARIDDALAEVERVALPANEMTPRERVIHLARQVNPNFTLQPPRNHARVAGVGSLEQSRTLRDRQGLGRRSTKHLASFNENGAQSARGQQQQGGMQASTSVMCRSQAGGDGRQSQGGATGGDGSLPPLGGQSSRSHGRSRSSKALSSQRSAQDAGNVPLGAPAAAAAAAAVAGGAGVGAEGLPPLSPSRQASNLGETSSGKASPLPSPLPKLAGRSSGGGVIGSMSGSGQVDFPEAAANTLIDLWEGTAAARVAAAAAADAAAAAADAAAAAAAAEAAADAAAAAAATAAESAAASMAAGVQEEPALPDGGG